MLVWRCSSALSPKSISRMRPPSSRITFSALMSRCSSPARCTALNARATSSPISAASRAPNVPCSPTSADSVLPRTKSVQKPTRPSCRSIPYTGTILGCRTDASARASRSMASYSASPPTAPGSRSLSATSRCRCGSQARYTSPNPPCPTRASSEKLPHAAPAAGASAARRRHRWGKPSDRNCRFFIHRRRNLPRAPFIAPVHELAQTRPALSANITSGASRWYYPIHNCKICVIPSNLIQFL